MKTHRRILLTVIVFCITYTGYCQPPTINDFGYNDLHMTGVARPLLTILVEYTDARMDTRNSPEFYENIFFGDGVYNSPNLFGEYGYYHKNSYFRFKFENAGIIGPFTIPDDPATSGCDESTYACTRYNHNIFLPNALKLAHEAGFDFESYDRNGDGIITHKELSILVITGLPPGVVDLGGGNRTTPGVIQLGNVRAQGYYMASVPEGGDTETILHEVSHQLSLGGVEPYGAESIQNKSYGMMSAVHKDANSMNSVHFDPYIKMRMGWLKPEILTNTESREIEIMASELGYDTKNRLYLVYNPRRGKREFFLLEYRYKDKLTHAERNRKPLFTWISRRTGDHYTTGTPQWTTRNKGRVNEAGYYFNRIEGLVENTPTTQATVPLYLWHSETRNDYFLTSNPSWAADEGTTRQGYRSHGIQGYVSPRKQGEYNTPLRSWWNPTRTDNLITTRDDSYAELDGYRFVREEGWIVNKPIINYDSDPFNVGDSTLPDYGLAIWHVGIDPYRKYYYAIPNPNLGGGTSNKNVLRLWWDEEGKDNMTTSRITWDYATNLPIQHHRNYRFTNVVGVLEKTAVNADMLPMYLWKNPERKDHFLTSNPAWAGEHGDTKQGYNFIGIQGYISDRPSLTYIKPLFSWWNPERKDNFTTGAVEWAGAPGDIKHGYRFVRVEGYMQNFGTDASLNIVPADGIEGYPQNNNGLWNESDGQAQLRWYDGSPAFRIEVLEDSQNSPVIKVKIN